MDDTVNPNGARPGHRPGPARGGSLPAQPATLWIKEKLADGEWHDYADMAKELAATDLPLPKHDTKHYDKANPRLSMARQAILDLARRQAYERELHPGTRRYWRVRKHPNRVAYSSLKVCARCGRPNLSVKERIRKEVEFNAPIRYYTRKDGGRSLSGDALLAKVATEYLCVPCADQELKAKGVTWNKKNLPDWFAEVIEQLSPNGVSDTKEAGNGK